MFHWLKVITLTVMDVNAESHVKNLADQESPLEPQAKKRKRKPRKLRLQKNKK